MFDVLMYVYTYNICSTLCDTHTYIAAYVHVYMCRDLAVCLMYLCMCIHTICVCFHMYEDLLTNCT